jgi:hypothetical protein
MTNSLYKQALEPSKGQANMMVAQAFSAIQSTLINSINNLRAAGQSATLNLDTVEDELNQARDEWLNHLKGTFDTHITQLKVTLQHYVKQP